MTNADAIRAATLLPSPSYGDAEHRAIWRAKIANVRQATEHFRRSDLVLDSRPFKAIVELTQNCNFRCIMCPQSWEERFKKYDSSLNMPIETFVKIAEELFPLAHVIDLRGFGETTILPYWPDVVDYLERYPFVVWHLVTNLSLPRDDTWDKMIKLGFSLGFSCDGATPEVFESIRTRSHFGRILHNLGLIQDAMRRYNRGEIYFISTIQKKNLHELRKLVELAHRYGVSQVQFKIVQDGVHQENIKVGEHVIAGYVNAALDAAIELGVEVTFNDWLFTQRVNPSKVSLAARKQPRRTQHSLPRYPDFDPTYWEEGGVESLFQEVDSAVRVSENQKCFKPYNFTYINYEAKMGTCNHMMYPDMLVMGDLGTQSVMETWNSEGYRDFRRQLITATPQDPRCQWCFKHRMDD